MAIGERHLFSWLHLSDLHFGHGDKSYGWDQQKVLENLRTDVQRALAWPELPRPQAILVTGDIAYSGGVKSDEYAAAEAFFRGLLSTLSLDPENLYCVPGNHDVQRGVASALVQNVRSNAEALDEVMASEEQRSLLFSRQAKYAHFMACFAERRLDQWQQTITVPDFGTVGLVGLNTALLCSDENDRSMLQLTGQQKRLLGGVDTTVRLVLTHHPFEDGWLRDQEALRSAVQLPPTVHLCGHTHDPRVDLAAQSGGQPHVRVVAAAAHRDPKEAEARKESHGYNFGSLVVDARGSLQIRSWPRRWFPQWQAFRVDHLGVQDRRFYDDKALGVQGAGSGLVLDGPDRLCIGGAHWWGDPPVRWSELLKGKSSFEIFGIAVRDLFEQPNIEHVQAFLERGGTVHAVLADPRAKTAMARYDEDFEKPLGDRSRKVRDVLKLIETLWSRLVNPDKLKVSLSRFTFKYSAYRLDDDVLFVPYRIAPGKKSTQTPALAFERKSTMVERFLDQDLDALRDGAESLTRDALRNILLSE